MKITLKNGNIALPIECANFTITPQFCNVWFNSFDSVQYVLEHKVCESVRVSVINNNYDSWRIGFKTEDIKIEI